MSNTRFHIKNQDGKDVVLRLALLRWAENGGKITKVKSSKRPKRGFTVGKNIKVGDK
jgi:hypothetical protein